MEEQHKDTKIDILLARIQLCTKNISDANEVDDDTMAEFWKAERGEAMHNLKTLKLAIKQG